MRSRLLVCAALLFGACSSDTRGHRNDGGGPGGNGDGGVPPGEDPTDCNAAAAAKSYVGCDYWPTVVGNNVWNIFDYAVVVANAGVDTANITVDGPNNVHQTQMVPPNTLVKIYLPWVSDLKGVEADSCGSSVPLDGTISHPGGAYHLTSSIPVTVYQFNALEYKGAGGAEFKDWSSCPGNQPCALNNNMPVGCFSFTNDASLLLPSTAMTGNYRVTGFHGSGVPGLGGMTTYFAVTGTVAGTQVTVKLSSTATVLAGGGVPATGPGGTFTFTVGAGDVVEVVGQGDDATDLSGSLVKANNPVQVITGVPCTQNPTGVQACDHMEESVFPAETLGQHYFVTVPTGPRGKPVGHVVRLYGNFDGTHLTYDPPVAGAPATLNAGQVVDLGVLTTDFEVKGDQSFAVGSFMLGGEQVDPNAPQQMQEGDPSQSMAVAVEQYRLKYVFLAPDDYDFSFVDVVAPSGTELMLDGVNVTVAAKPIGGSGFGVVRVPIPKSGEGAHVLTSTAPVGIQVMGYGLYTSYQYPGGLDLNAIAPVPIG